MNNNFITIWSEESLMKNEAEYRNELYRLVEAMDDETFEQWYGAVQPDSRYFLPAPYGARFQLIKAKRIMNLVAARKQT